MSDFGSSIQITGVIRGNSTVKAGITNRPTHTVIYKISGESIYHLRGESIRLSAGRALYIPEGETYTFEKVSEGESLYHLVNFHCSPAIMEKPQLFLPHSSANIESLFIQMEQNWNLFHNDTNRYKLLSLFYNLIFVLLSEQDRTYYTSNQKQKLTPALQYLEENLYSHDLSISTLASLCGISTVTFRNLFFAQLGEPPKKYIIRCRMLKAKTIMENGEFNSIHEVAQGVGYEDPLYFSRHFKQYFGLPPSKMFDGVAEDTEK